MNNVNVHIMHASRKLDPFLEMIRTIERVYLPTVCDQLGASDVDIIICDDASRAIPETGVGGWAHHANLLACYIDPNSENLSERLDFELKSTLAHELNHVTRWRTIGYKHSLLNSIISDGLADHFDLAVNGGGPRPWDIALSREDLIRYIGRAKTIWNDELYNHSEWYFGTGDIPRWAGYSLGFKLVSDYIERTGERDVKILVGTPAEEFIK